MKADITRSTFDPSKHFRRVIMQQGRVQLDADWNEQAAILLKYLQALAADLIGPYGGPIANPGFQIVDGMSNNFAITPGRYYVDGILCELGSHTAPVPITLASKTPPIKFTVPTYPVGGFSVGKQALVIFSDSQPVLADIKVVDSDSITVTGEALSTVVQSPVLSPAATAYSGPVTFLHQPDYPLPEDTKLAPGLIYLDVWERLVTYSEDDSIREVALNGADTAARSKLVCQVKHWTNPTIQSPTPSKYASALKSNFQPADRGHLKAQAKQTSTSADPCVIAPDASYRGPENQLYRVEIHTPGTYAQGDQINTSGPTFKWSRENGSVVLPIVSLTSGSGTTTVVLENLGRDDRFGLKENDWVEIQDDDYVLQNRAETLLQVQSINSGSLTVTLAGTQNSNTGHDQAKHPLLRRWDQTTGDPAQGGLQPGSDNAGLILEGSNDANWLDLEDGVQIQFQAATSQTGANRYRTGDYWLIPARTATGGIEWPTGQGGPLAVPPDGVEHHYAPLAVISVDSKGVVTVAQYFYQTFHPVSLT